MTEPAETYACAACGETFEKAWTDDEAKAEAKELWGDIPEDQMVIICDDCHKRGMARLRGMPQ